MTDRVQPKTYRGHRDDFRSLWSHAPETVDIRMAGQIALMIDRDGRVTTTISPGDRITVRGGRIVKTKA